MRNHRHALVWYFATPSRVGLAYGHFTAPIAVLLRLVIAATLLLGAQVIAEYERLGRGDRAVEAVSYRLDCRSKPRLSAICIRLPTGLGMDAIQIVRLVVARPVHVNFWSLYTFDSGVSVAHSLVRSFSLTRSAFVQGSLFMPSNAHVLRAVKLTRRPEMLNGFA
jgi:hypothetical protein